MRLTYKKWGIVAWMLVVLSATALAKTQIAGLHSFEERYRASAKIDRRLSSAEAVELFVLLERLPAADPAREGELDALKNNAADTLLRQESMPPGLFAVFRRVFADPRQGNVWREYVVQKLPELCLRLEGEEQHDVLSFLRERTTDTDYIFAGTALIGLDRLCDQRPDLVPGSEIKDRALTILISDRQADACKISALQILARYDATAALSRARDYLQGEPPVMLKVSALATLGMVGQPTDRPLLERYANSPELRLRTAARAALAKRFRSEPDKSERGQ